MTGEEIKKIRGKYGLTQQQLADKTEVSVFAVRSWEQGHRCPSKWNVKRIERLADKLESIK